MCLHVAFQFARLRTSVVTQVAFVRFLSRVAAPVHYEIALKLEGLAAKLTTLCFCWGVGGRRRPC